MTNFSEDINLRAPSQNIEEPEITLQDPRLSVQGRQKQDPPPAPGAYVPGSYWARTLKRDIASERQIAANLLQASRVNPDLAASIRSIGLELDVSPHLISEKDLPRLEEIHNARQFNAFMQAGGNEHVARVFLDPNFAAIALDDYENLGVISKAMAHWDAKALLHEQGQVEASIALGGDPDGTLKKRSDEIDALILGEARGGIGPGLPMGTRQDGLIMGFVYGNWGTVSQMWETMLISGAAGFGAGLATAATGVGAPIAPLVGKAVGLTTLAGLSGRVEGGHHYKELVDMGVHPDIARQQAFGVGLISGALEAGGMSLGIGAVLGKAGKSFMARQVAKRTGAALLPLKRGDVAKRVVGGYLRGLGSEVATENLQEITAYLSEEMAISRSERGDLDLEGRAPLLDRLGEITYETVRGVAIISSFGPTIQLAGDIGRVQNAKIESEQLTNLREVLSESKVLPRSPDSMAEALDQFLEGTDKKTLFFDVEKFKEQMDEAGLTEEELAKRAPEIAQRLKDAEKTGEMEIPLSGFGAKFIVEDFGKSMIPHARREAGGMSFSEIQEMLGEDVNELAAEGERLIEEAQKENDSIKEEVEKIRKQVFEDTVAAGFDRRKAAVIAKLNSNVLVSLAERANMSPAKFNKLFPIKIRLKDDAAPTEESLDTALDFEQPADATFNEADHRPEVVSWAKEQFGDRVAPNGRAAAENFVAWFGDSKAVDEKGAPLVVMHGGKDVTVFDPTKAPHGGQTKGQTINAVGTWFTTDEGMAQDLVGFPGTALTSAYLSMRNPFVLKHSTRYGSNAFRIALRHQDRADQFFKDFPEPKTLSVERRDDPDLAEARKLMKEKRAKAYDTIMDLQEGDPFGQMMAMAMESQGLSRERGDQWPQINGLEFRELLESQGYDGIILEETNTDFTPRHKEGVAPTWYIAFDPTQIKSTANLGDFAPEQPGILEQPAEQPTRLPSGKDSKEDAQVEMTVVNYRSAMQEGKKVAENAKTIREMNFLRSDDGMTDEEVVEAYVDHVASNLDWLFNQMSPEDRERSRKWYVGGRKFVDRWSKRYGIHPGQAAGIIAVLSPQKDWFVNITMAERMLDIVFNAESEVWGEEMSARAADASKTPREAKIGERDVTLPKGYKLKDVAKEEVEELGLKVPGEKTLRSKINAQKAKLKADKKVRVEGVTEGKGKDKKVIQKGLIREIKEEAQAEIDALTGDDKKARATKIRTARDKKIVQMKKREIAELNKKLDALNEQLAVPALTVLPKDSIAKVQAERDRRVATLPSQVEGKKFSEVPVELQPYWVRVYDQTHNDPSLRRLTPEGGVSGNADQNIQWTAYETMAKVLSILRDGSRDNISQQLGTEHKVRSFYNNLVAPWSKKGHLTVDTHAVAAAYLKGLAASDTEVSQAWGGKGATTSLATGLKGFYPYLWEAYRRAGEKHGMLPREMQSITWEQIRALFGAEDKRGTLPAEVNAVWDDYGAGTIEIDEAREKILEIGGGFDPMFWDGIPADAPTGRTYEGKSADESIADRGRPVGEPTIGAEAKPNLNPDLMIEWNKLDKKQRTEATLEILERVAYRVANRFGTNILVVPQRGGWGDAEASIALLLDDLEHAIPIADMIGAGTYQESMFILGTEAAEGLEKKHAVTVTLPAGMSAKEIDALYEDVIWPTEVNGKRVAFGSSARDRYMIIAGLDENVADSLRAALDEKLDDTFGTHVVECFSTQRNHAQAVKKDEDAHYGDITSEGERAAGGPPVEARSPDDDTLGAEAPFDDIYREVLEKHLGEPALDQPATAPLQFFSALARGIAGHDTKVTTAAGWKQALKSLLKKGEVKKDEIFWTGLEEWLDLQEGKITEEQIAEYLEGSGVKVEVMELVSMTEQEARLNRMIERRAILERSNEHELDAVIEAEDKFRQLLISDGASIANAEAILADARQVERMVDIDYLGVERSQQTMNAVAKLMRLRDEGRRERRDARDVSMVRGLPADDTPFMAEWRELNQSIREARMEVIRRPKFADYTLPDGENYREVLVSLPTRVGEDFTGGHYGETVPNVVVHLRVNDRIDADGNRVLFIEEIQSDWGQKGRDKGFAQPLTPKEIVRLQELRLRDADGYHVRQSVPNYGQTEGDWYLVDDKGEWSEETWGSKDEALEALKHLEDSKEGLTGRESQELWDLLSDQEESLRLSPQSPFVSTEQTASLRVVKEKQEITDKKTGKTLTDKKTGEPQTRSVPVAYEVYYGKDKKGDPVLHKTFEDKASASAEVARLDALKKPIENTKSWLNLALKQVMMMAVEGNYDQVAFVTGEQSAARYDLSKKVESIDVTELTSGGYQGIMAVESKEVALNLINGDDLTFYVTPDGTVSDFVDSSISDWKGKPLAEVVGKEVAEKIMAAEGEATLKGEDLKVGGEGMKAFYNEIIPQAVKKLVGKVGGKVETVDYREGANFRVVEDLPGGPFAVVDRKGNRLRDGYSTRADAEAALPDAERIHPEATEKIIGNQPTLKITDEMRESVQAEGGAPLFAPGESRGQYVPSSMDILLSEDADTSTVLHELMHHYTNAMLQIANMKDAPKEILEDVDTMMRWWKIAGDTAEERLANWNAMSFAEQAPHHEALTYNYELWLFNGTAPTVGLRKLFEKIRTFMIGVYTSLLEAQRRLSGAYQSRFGRDLPSMNTEIRDMFERLVAGEQAARNAEAVRSMGPLFESLEVWKEHGGTESEWIEYKKKSDEWRQKLQTDLSVDSMRAMGWQEKARGRVLAEIQREKKAKRKATEKEITAEVEREPIYQVLAFLKEKKTGLDRDSVLAMLGDLDKDAIADIKKKLGRSLRARKKLKGGQTEIQGLMPDFVAEFFGFKTGEELVRALIAARPIKEEISVRTSALMEARYGDLNSEEAIQHRVEQAIHSEARSRFVAAELKFLEKTTRPVRIKVAAAREAARKILAGKRIEDIDPRKFAQLEARAAREAKQAMKTVRARTTDTTEEGDIQPSQRRTEGRGPDMEAAIVAKERELLYNQLAKLALEVREEVNKAKDTKRFTQSDSKLGKTRNVNIVHVARAILAQYGLLPPGAARRTADFIERLREYSPELYTMYESQLAKAQVAGELAGYDYRNMTLDEFRAMNEMIETLWYYSKRENEIELEGKREKLQEIVTTLTEALESRKRQTIPGQESGLGDKHKVRVNLLQSAASLVKLEHYLRYLDGGKQGPFTKYLYNQVKEAINAYRADAAIYTKQFVELLDGLRDQGLLDDQSISSHELGYEFGGRDSDVGGMTELIGALLHMGNAGNKSKFLVGGRGDGKSWAFVTEDGDIKYTKWNAFIERMIDDGRLKKEHFDFVQNVWNLMEEIKPKLQSAHIKLKGHSFPEVPAEAFEITFKDGTTVTYRGGYVPATPDTQVMREVGTRTPVETTLESLETEFYAGLPKVPDGMTKEREDNYRENPLSMNLDMIIAHIDKALRYSHIQPAAKDMQRILTDESFKKAMHAVDPDAIDQLFLPFLDRAVTQSLYKEGAHPGTSMFFKYFRRIAGVKIMAGNIVNTLQQFTGLINATLYVKAHHVRNGLWQLLTNRRDLTDLIISKSKFMDDRLQNQMFELSDEMREIVLHKRGLKGKGKALQRKGLRWGYFLQATAQNMVDICVWKGAFEQAMESPKQGESMAEQEARAVIEADSAVRLSQGSFSPEDVAGYEKGTAAGRAWTQFTSYFNTVLNQVVFAQKGDKIKTALIAFSAPMIVAEAIAMTLWGKWDDEDDDGHVDTAWDLLGGSQWRGAAAMVPAFGPTAVQAIDALFEGRQFGGDRVAAPPATAALTRSVMGTAYALNKVWEGDKDFKSSDVRDVLSLIIIGFPLGGAALAPLGKSISYATQLGLGEVEPTGPIDILRGFASGRASEGTKK